MTLTVKQLIEKLEKVEDKGRFVLYETPVAFHSVDRVFIDERDKDIILTNIADSEHCDCEACEEDFTQL